MKQLRDKAEKFAFQAEVNRMMKLIINSLYRNKEVCTCEEGRGVESCGRGGCMRGAVCGGGCVRGGKCGDDCVNSVEGVARAVTLAIT